MIRVAENFFRIILCAVILSTPGHAQVRFCAVGDVLLDRSLRKSIEAHASVDYPFQKIRSIIKQNDIALCNLECSVTAADSGYPLCKRFVFRAEPEFLKGLKAAGFNLASVANNHTMDWGKAGFLQTITNLNDCGILPVGGGKNQKAALTPILVEKNGETFAFFGILEFLLEAIIFDPEEPYPAFGEIEELCKKISEYNDRVDYIVVTIHWGVENDFYPTSRQFQYAHSFIDAGADLVLGHHPHVLQSLEFYQNKLIVYSLGNFVFDNRQPDQRKTVIFECEFFKGQILNPGFIPIIIQENQPQPADDKNSKEIFHHFQKVSKGLNTGIGFENNRIKVFNACEIQNPVKEILIDNSKFSFREFQIDVTQNQKLVQHYALPDSAYRIKDVCWVAEDQWYYFYGIVENVAVEGQKMIAIFPYNSKTNQFYQPSLDPHTDFGPWKIRAADVDRDGNPELIVGVYKSTRYFPEKDNRIFVYNREKEVIYPKWFGSKLHWPLLDFKIEDFGNDRNPELITLEHSVPMNQYRITSYLWNGFGLDELQQFALVNNYEEALNLFKTLPREFYRFR